MPAAELAERGLKVDYRSVWEFVHAEKLSFKKSVVAGERDRPDVARVEAFMSWSPNRNARRVAVVAGATRGAGRGIAAALGEVGATIVCTGRSTSRSDSPMRSGN